MKYKVGDRVKIQSLERYNKYKNRHGDINYGCETEILFTSEMSSFCGQVVTITQVRYIGCVRFYHLAEDKGVHLWVDGMFEGLAEEETIHNKWTGLKVELELSETVIGVSNVESVNGERFMSGFVKAIIPPEGCQLVDENGNVINATKIVLEKKKKEYPKTYEECCKVLNVAVRDLDILDNMLDTSEMVYRNNLDRLLNAFRKLLICRDAYWKIAGDWKPEFRFGKKKYCIMTKDNKVVRATVEETNRIFVFPTAEMRDAFYENFKGLINECKELL